MISVSNLAKWYGDQTLFEGVSCQLNAGDRYGLVGANGSGKTTLLNILTGAEEASAGVVAIPSKAKLGVLRQDQFLYDDEEVLGVAMRGDPELWHALVEKEKLLAHAATHFDADRYDRLEETIQRHDGYAAEARAAEILEGLGLTAETHRRPMSALSGGFKLRVLLAQALAGAPDALLLDEPTNHLDIISIRWLEKFLRAFAGPVVVISHDHRFLDNVVTHILDVDYQTVTLYHGAYEAFMAAKQAERERREKEIVQREKEIAHHQEFIDRFRAKNTKARQAQSKLRIVEKKAAALEPLPPSSRRWPTFRFRQKRPSGRDVLTLNGISKSFGHNVVLEDVDLAVRRGERVALIGPNGIGKSTLLKIAVGALEPDAGTVVWGHEARPGYFAQDHHEQLDDEPGNAEQWLAHRGGGLDRGAIRAALGLVLFSGDEAEKPVAALSGGEAARLVFARLSIEKPNVLVLDEPTNHLDLEAIEALVDGLLTYDGTLVFVSHDRWFVSKLATRIVEITRAGMRDYHGTYQEYVHALGDDHLDADTVLARAARARGGAKDGKKTKDGAARPRGANDPAPRRQGKTSDSDRLVRRRDEVTALIAAGEARLREIDAALADPAVYEAARLAEVKTLGAERAELERDVARLMAEWEALERDLEPAV